MFQKYHSTTITRSTIKPHYHSGAAAIQIPSRVQTDGVLSDKSFSSARLQPSFSVQQPTERSSGGGQRTGTTGFYRWPASPPMKEPHSNPFTSQFSPVHVTSRTGRVGPTPRAGSPGRHGNESTKVSRRRAGPQLGDTDLLINIMKI